MFDGEDKIAMAKMGVAAGGFTISSLTLNEWVALLTICYLLLQMGLLIPKYVQMVRDYFGRKGAE